MVTRVHQGVMETLGYVDPTRAVEMAEVVGVLVGAEARAASFNALDQRALEG